MKTKTYQLKQIQPNPFRDFIQNPLDENSVENLIESVKSTQFWENLEVRINADGKPELVYGHHTLEALRRVYPSTKEFDWRVVSLTDGQMIQKMARENLTQRGPSVGELFEAIKAAVAAHGAGQITDSEMPLSRDTRKEVIRYAPSFSQTEPSTAAVLRPYTVDALAKFLGLVKSDSQKPKNSFEAAFGALELISEGYLTDARIKGLEIRKLGEVVAAVKKERDHAIKESKRLAAEAEAHKKEAERKAAELEKQRVEAEERRKAAVEAERVAAIKRAEEKARRDAEEVKRRVEEEKRRKAEAEARAEAEAKRRVEEERLRKIREAQREEAEKQRVEAERIRQIAIAKAKKEEDERKSAQMKRDAEAAAARAEAEAKRKEEAARQAEIAARRRELDEKERQMREKKKRDEEEAHKEAKRKAQQEEYAQKLAARIAEDKRRVAEAQKAADEAAKERAKKKAEADALVAEAQRKSVEAKKEADAAKARAASMAARLAEEAKTMNRDDIRARGQEIAEDLADAAVGSDTRVNPDDVRRVIDEIKDRTRSDGKHFATPIRVPKPSEVLVLRRLSDMVEFAYREFAKTDHPDKGGSHEKMQILNAAVAMGRDLIKEKKKSL